MPPSPSVANLTCDAVINDLPYADESDRAVIAHAIRTAARSVDGDVPIGTIWQQLPTTIRLSIIHADLCRRVDVPNTMRVPNPDASLGMRDYLWLLGDAFSSPFPRRADFKKYPGYVVGFFIFWTSVVGVIGAGVLAVRSC